MRRIALIAGALTICFGIALVWLEVAKLADDERDVAGNVMSLQDSLDTYLVQSTLVHHQKAHFELCAEAVVMEGWAARAVTIWFLNEDGTRDQVRRIRFSDLVQRMEQQGDAFCVNVVHWDSVLIAGEYAVGVDIGAIPDSEDDTRIRARILSWRAASFPGRAGILVLLFGIVLIAFGFTQPVIRSGTKTFIDKGDAGDDLGDTGAPPEWKHAPGNVMVRVALGITAVVATMLGLAFVRGGSVMIPVRGLVICLVQLSLAFALVHPRRLAPGTAPPPGQTRAEALALVGLRPDSRWKRAGGWVLLIVAGVVIFRVGRLVAGFIPSTGLAPIEAALAAPSGSLAIGLIATLAPLAEEIFFRGFVYTALENRFGKNVAFVASWGLFAVAHLPQQWGAWGAFASVALAGFAFTLIRRLTGSSLASGVAHVTHNGFINVLALL
ncbi:MAG: hypothetical protein ACI9KE_003480 [Polyangiales bacterium]|jgi:hypothetical protein